MRLQALSEARLLVRQSDTAVISTISHNLRGYPFGSVSPYISDNEGRLYFYISDIAQHSKNLTLDSRLSVTVFTKGESGDQNTQARVTVVGDAYLLGDEEAEHALARYCQRYPEAESYSQAHDFKMWRMDIKRVRYIGGFGRIFWLETEEWISEDAPWDKTEEDGMIQHMNEDHQDAMSLILKQHHKMEDKTPTMSGILSDGCYFRSGEKNFFVPFKGICVETSDARKQLVQLTHAARATM